MLKSSQSFFVFRIQSKEIFLFFFFFYKKKLFKEKGSGELNKKKKKRKEGFLTAFTTVIKKDPTMSIRKQAHEFDSPRENYEDTNKYKIKSQTLTPLITLYGAFLKTKQMQLPI